MGRDSSSPEFSPSDRVSVSTLDASRLDDAPTSQKAERDACGLPSPSEGQATGLLWLGPTTPVCLCDDHLNEFSHLRFAVDEDVTPDEVDAVRSAAYDRLLEERPECVECATSGTVLRWYDE